MLAFDFMGWTYRKYWYLFGIYACMLSGVQVCNPWDNRPPGSSVHGILQARILEWVAISYFRNLLDPGIEPMSLVSLALAGRFFSTGPPGKPFVSEKTVVIHV